jgi:hypothetical protein
VDVTFLFAVLCFDRGEAGPTAEVLLNIQIDYCLRIISESKHPRTEEPRYILEYFSMDPRGFKPQE